MNTKSKVVSGFLLGAAIGTAAGLMLAPRSGKKTMQKLQSKSKRMANDLIEKANASLNSAKASYNQKINDYTKRGKSSMDNLSESIHVQ